MIEPPSPFCANCEPHARELLAARSNIEDALRETIREQARELAELRAGLVTIRDELRKIKLPR